MSEQHSSPIKTPQQLVWVIVLSFLVPVAAIILLAGYFGGAKSGGAGAGSMTPEAVADRLKPIGTVALAGASGPKALQTGEAVYKLACSACHTAGVAGAPKTGDAAAWAPRLKQGYDTLVKHAVEGFKTMPAKGGNTALDNVEVARAVVYMANASGAKFAEPAAPAAATATAPAAAATAPAAAAAPAERSGEEIVKAACGSCHTDGKQGAPKIGDRAAWAKRVSQGVDKVTAAAIRGHDGMPSRGGMASITDAEMRKAVLFMFNAGGGTAAPAAASPAAVAAAPAGKAGAASGEKLYKASCTVCHAAGVAGAPKTGDVAAWASRAKLGVDALTASVIKGKGAMPPRGTAATATDAEIRAAVEYMLARAK